MGANTVINTDENQDGNLREVAPEGFDIVIDATGVPAMIQKSFDFLKPRGQFLRFGVAPKGQTIGSLWAASPCVIRSNPP
jgi:threonine dehydrogenase-like Zn-dependent dehydrogenase